MLLYISGYHHHHMHLNTSVCYHPEHQLHTHYLHTTRIFNFSYRYFERKRILAINQCDAHLFRNSKPVPLGLYSYTWLNQFTVLLAKSHLKNQPYLKNLQLFGRVTKVIGTFQIYPIFTRGNNYLVFLTIHIKNYFLNTNLRIAKREKIQNFVVSID